MNFIPLEKFTAQNLNPQVLAFVGDGVHTLYIRTHLAITHPTKSGELHKMAQNYVKAGKQSEAVDGLLAELTEEETTIYKRARNYKTASVAKSSTAGEYKKATGYEAVLGYLYLTGNTERLNYLLKISSEKL